MSTETNPKLLTRRQAAEYLGVKYCTLEMWAHTGRPELPYIRVGGAARYRQSDLDLFLESRTATSATAHSAALATAASL
jgi:excisionase family DNA binding protein